MTTMKAVTYDRFGDDSVLAVSEQPVPPVGPGEVLVRVKAAGVNPVDWKVMSGGLASLMVAQFPVVPGWDVAGVVESVKAAADVYMPVAGEIVEVNEALRADPSLANSDPLGAGWFFKVKLANAGELDGLMDETAYTSFAASA